MGNGSTHLDELELAGFGEVLGAHRPAAVAPAARLGEGAFAAALRLVIAALAVGGRTEIAWRPPSRLAKAGFKSLDGPPAAVLVCSLAAGGSAVAAVVTRP